MMKELIQDFGNHLTDAIRIAEKTNFEIKGNKINSVLICGLGGSGIGGTIISEMLSNECQVPIIVNKDYHIPSFVNQNTLAICCSYSGNTEETLEMYKRAKEKGAEISIITSGGKFADLAKTNGHNILQIPGGLPPRAAFGLAFPQLLYTFKKYGLISDEKTEQLKASVKLLDATESEVQQEAKSLSEKLHQHLPVIYSEASLGGVGVRFRQQLNENSKMLAWSQVIPEMNHNELVGWRSKYENIAVLIFRTETDYYRNQKRIEYSKKVFGQYTSNINEVFAKGDNVVARTIYLIHLGDWISFYLAEAKGIDVVEVDVITGLKEMLAELE